MTVIYFNEDDHVNVDMPIEEVIETIERSIKAGKKFVAFHKYFDDSLYKRYIAIDKIQMISELVKTNNYDTLSEQ